MHKQKLAICIAASIGALSIFLPWVSMPIVGSINGTTGNAGWVGAALYCIPLVFVLIGNRTLPILTQKDKIITILPGLIVSIIGIYRIIEFKNKMSDIPTDNPFASALSNSISLQLGIFLFIVAGIGITVSTFMLGKEKS